MILKNIKEKLKTVLSLVLALLQVTLYYFMLLWKTVQYFIAYQLARLFKRDLTSIESPEEDLMNYSSGIVFLIILLFIVGIYLDGQAGKYIGKDKKWHAGKYLFTVDFAHPESNILDTDHSEIPHEHKCAHIIALDDGNFAAQPNNRCIWDIPSFTVKDDIPDWKVQTSEWNVEDSRAWRTEDTDKFFYEIEEKKMIKKVKQLAGHYWMDHKIEVVIFAVLIVSLIIK